MQMQPRERDDANSTREWDASRTGKLSDEASSRIWFLRAPAACALVSLCSLGTNRGVGDPTTVPRRLSLWARARGAPRPI